MPQIKIRARPHPHAFFDQKRRVGWLAHYYPHDAVKEGIMPLEQWRGETWSGEILNYKEGAAHDLRQWVAPFIELLDGVLGKRGAERVVLVPMPSSLPDTDPAFSRVARQKGNPKARNRDDRNIAFCNLVAAERPDFEVHNLIRRIEKKPPKATWDSARHAKSFSVADVSGIRSTDRVVLVDDVYTKGGTVDGAKLALAKAGMKATIVVVVLGRTRAPADFIAFDAPAPDPF